MRLAHSPSGTGVDRPAQACGIDQVTARFYERFRAEHAAFTACIEGIADEADRAWYGTLMLNRLMFLCFLQPKGLNANPDDLRSRLGAGLFGMHEIEQRWPAITIPDQAFGRLLDFFARYSWELDDAPLRRENQITPDVLGYIFEKYINQKQMGAYYTKEDITRYISGHTIIPYLLEQLAAERPADFGPGGQIWRLLAAHPERYIPRSRLHGVDQPLPPAVAAGVSDPAARDLWHRTADAAFGLPMETWREHIARRQKVEGLRHHLAAGEVTGAHELIHHNLDGHRLLLDLIGQATDPTLVLAIYQALTQVTVLDPTCGSGAFLLAALKLLQPLYGAAIDRLRALPAAGMAAQAVLAQVEAHPNQGYYIVKAIISHNLYGVDIMAEAVEICKLRLYLKLIAQVDSPAGLEPLPAIDANIRAGNVLAGYCTNTTGPHAPTSGAPFTWQAAFARILARGGFDVIIGNPPYVEYAKVKADYTVQGLETLRCGNLYAMVMERCLALQHQGSRSGLIVLIGSICTERMAPLQDLYSRQCDQLYLSSYSGHTCPGILFEGAANRYAIWLSRKGAGPAAIAMSKYQKWYAAERAHLFDGIDYTAADPWHDGTTCKLAGPLAAGLLAKLQGVGGTLAPHLRAGSGPEGRIWIYTTPIHWVKAFSFQPFFRGEGRSQSTQLKEWPVDPAARNAVLCLLNSSLFFWWWISRSDCYHLTSREVRQFPVDMARLLREQGPQLTDLAGRLMADLQARSTPGIRNQKTTGRVEFQVIDPRGSKPIIDQIDTALARHYGFTPAELDFIIHFDLKYRLGQDASE